MNVKPIVHALNVFKMLSYLAFGMTEVVRHRPALRLDQRQDGDGGQSRVRSSGGTQRTRGHPQSVVPNRTSISILAPCASRVRGRLERGLINAQP